MDTDCSVSPELQDLTLAVHSGQCVAFVGAGMSSPDYPKWEELIEKMCVAYEIRDPERRTWPELAERVKRQGEANYKSFLRGQFPRKHPQYRHIYLAGAPFFSFVTTNYDSFIEQAWCDKRGLRQNVFLYPFLNYGALQRDSLYHLHGMIDYEADFEVVLAASEYEEAYGRASYVDSLLKSMLARPVCFIGCSFTDDYLRPLLKVCCQLRTRLLGSASNGLPKWFALLDRDGASACPATELGVTAVRYEKLTSDHEGLLPILRTWSRSPSPLVCRPGQFDARQELPQ